MRTRFVGLGSLADKLDYDLEALERWLAVPKGRLHAYVSSRRRHLLEPDAKVNQVLALRIAKVCGVVSSPVATAYRPIID